jgi:dihydrofolate reductase
VSLDGFVADPDQSEENPLHTPVFVLTHHPREPLEMEGGTTFVFITEGIEAALEQATEPEPKASAAVPLPPVPGWPRSCRLG